MTARVIEGLGMTHRSLYSYVCQVIQRCWTPAESLNPYHASHILICSNPGFVQFLLYYYVRIKDSFSHNLFSIRISLSLQLASLSFPVILE